MPRTRTDTGAPGRFWKVGELAERTGLTVRTLHHYDAIGLLCPSGRTGSDHGSGHRLYTAEDVARLQQVLSLKQLGFGLEQIREYLSRDDYDPRQVVRMHLARVRGQAEELRRLADRLAALADALDKAETVSADEFLTAIEGMTMIEKLSKQFEEYYTPEQLAQFEARAKEVGQEVIDQAPQMWADLFTDLNAAMEAGIDPADPRGQELARRWWGLVSLVTGGDEGIFLSMKRMYDNEPTVAGMDVSAIRPGMEFIYKAAAAAGIKIPGT